MLEIAEERIKTAEETFGVKITAIVTNNAENMAKMRQLLKEQAGTGRSRRHIQGSKIAKGHQSFKVFSSSALNFFLKKVSQR